MSLSPELRRRIFEEERFRAEARERAQEEARLRRRNASSVVNLVWIAGLFVLGYSISSFYLVKLQRIPEQLAPVQQTSGLLAQAVLDDVAQALREKTQGAVCVRAVGRGQLQIKATIELAQDSPLSAARRLALAKATEVGAVLRRHGLALPAFVEVFSPARWYGMAVYDRDTLRVSWDACPGRCEQEGTQYVRHCQATAGDQPSATPNR